MLFNRRKIAWATLCVAPLVLATPASAQETPERNPDTGRRVQSDEPTKLAFKNVTVEQIVPFLTETTGKVSREGLLVGISSGANVLAAARVAASLGPGHTVVTVLCDRGERYLSTVARRPH